MKNYVCLLLLMISGSLAFAQKQTAPAPQAYEEPTEENRKYIYNYTYGSYLVNRFSNPANNVMAFNSVTYVANGRQQFGIGTGIQSQSILSDSGRMRFVSVPIFISNKFYFIKDVRDGGFYLDFMAGYNLQVSSTYESGDRSGNLIPGQLLKNTGFYGASIGTRMVCKKSHDVSYIAELAYRNQGIPYAGNNTHIASGVWGINIGLSF